MEPLLDVYLDDTRPAPEGWLLCRTIHDVIRHLDAHHVRHLSLDHDLGACTPCLGGLTECQWFETHGRGLAMPHCAHIGTGLDLCLYMERTGSWSFERPTVHSANPRGAAKMRQVIARAWRPPGEV